MANTNLIARIYPHNESTGGEAHAVIQQHKQHKPAKRIPLPRGSRESTPGVLLDSNDMDSGLDTLPYLELTFAPGPATSKGFTFGLDKGNSVVLSAFRDSTISRHHCALTFKKSEDDGLYRLIVQDLGSKHGTAVTYRGEERQLRTRFQWIIHGFSPLASVKSIILILHEHLQFRIIVEPMDIASPQYVDRVQQFLKGTKTPEEGLYGLDIQSGTETKRQSQVATPSSLEEPVYLELSLLGQGSFGSVMHVWNVSTGRQYARKRPKKDFQGMSKKEVAGWMKEINIMKGISHDNIVKLHTHETSSTFDLYLEYMPGGDLRHQHYKVAPFSREECMVILQQSLAALAYLHRLPTPITHRDIKPDNILVQQRDKDNKDPDKLHIRLSDFGLSRYGASSMMTCAGTLRYMPLEIVLGRGQVKYTNVVDVWSLGVAILELICHVPHSNHPVAHCQMIAGIAQNLNQDSDGLHNLLRKMLALDPKWRPSAATCLEEAQRLMFPHNTVRSTTPTQASYAAGRQALQPIPAHPQGHQSTVCAASPALATGSAATTVIHAHSTPHATASGSAASPVAHASSRVSGGVETARNSRTSRPASKGIDRSHLARKARPKASQDSESVLPPPDFMEDIVIPPVVKADHVFYYSEPSYANGSYLAPANRSFEQLQNM